MDTQSLEYSKGLLDEIEAAIAPLELKLTRLEPEQTGGIPTGLIGALKGPDGSRWEIACNVIPSHVDELSTAFVQLYLQLTAPAPDRQGELADFVRGCNEQFIVGSLLLFSGCLCMKYTLTLDPEQPLPAEHFQSALVAFVRQAGAYARLGGEIAAGRLSAAEALSGSRGNS